MKSVVSRALDPAGTARGPKAHGRAGIAAGCARHRFALAGVALALAAGVFAPMISRATGVAIEATVALLLAIGAGIIGWLVGRRVDALTEQAFEDPATRVGNRRHLDEQLAEEVTRAQHSHMPLSLLLLDVDNLKRINDEHGHGAGDIALGIVGEVLLETCRAREVPARFGGDEFAMILPRTRAGEACVVAERIRSALSRRRTAVGAPLESLLTVSIGIADLSAVREARTDLLFEAADAALYRAKQRGRDRVEVEPERLVSGVIELASRRAKNGRASA